MIILGIDPGYDKLGIAVIEKKPGEKREKYIYSDCFRTDKKLSHPERLCTLTIEIERILNTYKPTLLGIEELFFNKNQRTATKVAEARGAILAAAARAQLSISQFSPAEIKIAVTGYGKSDKKQIISMIPKLISVQKTIQEDDEYDALAAALTASATHGRSQKSASK